MQVLLYFNLKKMAVIKRPLLSIIVPVYNEADGLEIFHDSLISHVRDISDNNYEIIYVNDGSTDGSGEVLEALSSSPSIKIISFSRNFGKEVATTAGIHQAAGDAIITIDADGQHPVELIPQFVQKWRSGSKVVIGVRTANQKEGLVKSIGSRVFYRVLNGLAGTKLVPRSTDFRLVDRAVQREFIPMTERNRITRGLIDWLGYKRDYIEFRANPRYHGDAGYSFKKLSKLFIDSIISLSISPLYISAYIGAVVLPLSALTGLFMLINAVFGDPAGIHATGSAYVVVFLVFLVGILLISQGIIGLYLSHIHTETQNRPLYVIDKEKSRNLE